ncbi:MAG: hypothetical protein KJ048_14535 [Dehalococcoidia bacterium]|nr:hypothetical protein [Dehalococcoidia bacterium]
MDVKIAVITGAAFAGVLVAGALAAPRGGGDEAPQESAGGPTSIINTGGDGNFVLEPALIGREDDDEWEDDEDEDEEHERHERDDDHDDDDDDDHEDDD